MSDKKISSSERTRLENLQMDLNDQILKYGRQKYIIEDIKDQLEEEKQEAKQIKQNISAAQTEYNSYVQDLYQKYGDVAIDLDNGDILPPEEL